MTHFFTLVLIPGTTAPDDIEEVVKRLLAPFAHERLTCLHIGRISFT
jgi:hypothetical protein